MAEVILSITFRDKEPFAAEARAVRFLESAGFSVGRKQAHAPRGILYGSFDIQKWRNLSKQDRDTLHGVLVVDYKDLNASFEVWDTLPQDLASKLHSTLEGRFLDATETFVANFLSPSDNSRAGVSL